MMSQFTVAVNQMSVVMQFHFRLARTHRKKDRKIERKIEYGVAVHCRCKPKHLSSCNFIFVWQRHIEGNKERKKERKNML